jgi:hypothetical protein
MRTEAKARECHHRNARAISATRSRVANTKAVYSYIKSGGRVATRGRPLADAWLYQDYQRSGPDLGHAGGMSYDGLSCGQGPIRDCIGRGQRIKRRK